MPFALLCDFHIIRDGPRRERSGAIRVNRGMHFVEPYATQDIHRLQELRFGLARKPDDYVGRQRYFSADRLADFVHLI